MSEKHPHRPSSGKPRRAFRLPGLSLDVLPLAMGFALALLAGWVVFPQLLYSRQEQPVAFSHATHLEKAGLVCQSCHRALPDGSFAGLPGLENCVECHSTPLGKSAEERRFIDEYIRPEKEIPWQSYAGQPAHVFFSHAAHSLERCNTCHQFSQTALCASCHADMSVSKDLPAYQENRITGYSRETMPMRACERCHALPGHTPTTAANDCAVCHK